MKITKTELKEIIKECVTEVLTENSQPKTFDFDAEWKRLDEAGETATHLTDDEYKSLMTRIDESTSYKSACNIFSEVLKG